MWWRLAGFASATSVLDFLHDQGLPVDVLASGGYVRDLLLGRISGDLDISLCLVRCEPGVTVMTIAEGMPTFAQRRPASTSDPPTYCRTLPAGAWSAMKKASVFAMTTSAAHPASASRPALLFLYGKDATSRSHCRHSPAARSANSSAPAYVW